MDVALTKVALAIATLLPVDMFVAMGITLLVIAHATQ